MVRVRARVRARVWVRVRVMVRVRVRVRVTVRVRVRVKVRPWPESSPMQAAQCWGVHKQRWSRLEGPDHIPDPNPSPNPNPNPKSLPSSLKRMLDNPALHACVCGNTPAPDPNPNPTLTSVCCTAYLPAMCTVHMQIIYLLLLPRCYTHSTHLCPPVTTKRLALAPIAGSEP